MSSVEEYVENTLKSIEFWEEKTAARRDSSWADWQYVLDPDFDDPLPGWRGDSYEASTIPVYCSTRAPKSNCGRSLPAVSDYLYGIGEQEDPSANPDGVKN